MSRRPIDGYLPYMDDMLTLWAELGDDFKVGGKTRADAQEMQNGLVCYSKTFQKELKRGNARIIPLRLRFSNYAVPSLRFSATERWHSETGRRYSRK